ncbi:MAG: 4-hydroxythreonine-4-phosphate dehydrogenase PdxA [Sphaerochaeta sp.]|nr:4-hydroxythreonine-4-phosphate dehydrogenase PdxA [Sphaerochaeta sp.]
MRNSDTYLAIPMGDPAGIGPEIILKTLVGASEVLPLVVVGSERLFTRTARDLHLEGAFEVVVNTLPSLQAAQAKGLGCILYDIGGIDLDQFVYGEVSAMCGKAAYESVKVCVSLVSEGYCKAIVTPPLHKEALQAAHVPHIGYTEILADLTGSKNAVTMFDTLGMKIFFHTRHLSLSEACKAVTKESLLNTILQCEAICSGNGVFNMDLPLAVAGLNPHCGEHGLFGDEEGVAIVPAIEEARARGINVVGPIGADSVFHQTKIGKYRAAISLYHDQGHIAAKTLDFNQTISLTWGLPFLRTSVDHGTAFDIAGKGIADNQGMARAIRIASEYLASEEGLS